MLKWIKKLWRRYRDRNVPISYYSHDTPKFFFTCNNPYFKLSTPKTKSIKPKNMV